MVEAPIGTPAKAPRAIRCPVCNNGLTLDDFTIVEHEDGTFTSGEAVLCTHDPCPAHFFITKSRPEFLPR